MLGTSLSLLCPTCLVAFQIQIPALSQVLLSTVNEFIVESVSLIYSGHRMQIYINGEEREVAAATSMAALIERLELTGKRIAVEVNEELVPRSTFEQHLIQANDRIEIINAVGGG